MGVSVLSVSIRRESRVPSQRSLETLLANAVRLRQYADTVLLSPSCGFVVPYLRVGDVLT